MSNPNSGFKGSLVTIADVEVRGRGSVGAIVKYRVLFTDAEGTVHAHTGHEVAVGEEDSPFREPLKALMEACRVHAEQAHFLAPATSAPTIKQVIARGIAEAVSGTSDAADEPGEPG